MFRLEIETDNAAFQDGNIVNEVARILQQVKVRILTEADWEGFVRDSNGNTVGTFKLSESED